MHHLISVIDASTGSATADEMAAIDVFNDQLRINGYWVLAGGLVDPSEATVIDNRGEEPVITEGPFIESTEYTAGVWIIQTPDLATARRLAIEASRRCNRRVELRTLL